ncbi:heme acquisition protein HasA [Yersinia bercovieri]|uniref:heme acquisition protein HasA n=1 Tax=Yersinia bercovieri TaxID=634 RepID=UPI0011AB2D54|nr:heme acquisition protein HasA [Yersinia bercovieri]
MTVSIQFNAPLGSATLATYSQKLKVGDIKVMTIIKNAEAETEDTANAKQALAKMCGSYINSEVDCGFISIDTGCSAENYPDMMIFRGELMYSKTPQNIFYGKLDSLMLGEGLIPSLDGIGQQLKKLELKFSGLNITSEFDAAKTRAENQQGEVHKVIDGLVQGNPDPLLEILQAKGIDINIPLNDMAIASQLETTSEITVNTLTVDAVDTVGVADNSDVLFA